MGSSGAALQTRITMAVTSKRLTVQEFLDLPEEEPPLEFVEGVVRQRLSPARGAAGPLPHS
jgi:hypothetical protein